MNRHGRIAAVMASCLVICGLADFANAQDNPNGIPADIDAAIKAAQTEIDATRQAFEASKAQLAAIADDSEYIGQVKVMLQTGVEYWSISKDALEGAKVSAAKIAGAADAAIANDYKLLAKVNASVARSSAKVVQISLAYIKAVANNQTEALGIISGTMQDAQASASQVQFNFERVKKTIAQKYSK